MTVLPIFNRNDDETTTQRGLSAVDNTATDAVPETGKGDDDDDDISRDSNSDSKTDGSSDGFDRNGNDNGFASRFWARDDSSSSSSSNSDGDDDGAVCDAEEEGSLTSTGDVPSSSRNDEADEDEERERLSLDPDRAWEEIRNTQVFLPPPVTRIPPVCHRPDGSGDRKNRDRERGESSDGGGGGDIVRFVFISDTHGKHRDLPHLPKGDVLVHAGDFTNSGETGTLVDLGRYFRELTGAAAAAEGGKQRRPAVVRTVVAVAGNHDVTLDEPYYTKNWMKFHRRRFDPAPGEAAVRAGAVYLRNESHLLEVPSSSSSSAAGKRGIHIWGSPCTPRFFDWAFNEDRGSPIRKIWDAIPSGGGTTAAASTMPPVDILIAHGPPLGRGDLAWYGERHEDTETTRAGCYDLLRAVQDRIRPRICAFGHVHEGYGVTYDGTTLYVNASSVNKNYEAVNLPIVVDLPVVVGDDDATAARVVVPSSLLRNRATSIGSLDGWTRWCRSRGHVLAAEILARRPPEALERFFDDDREPPPDRFFETLRDDLGFHRGDPSERTLRPALAAVVFHLYALSFEEGEEDDKRRRRRPTRRLPGRHR